MGTPPPPPRNPPPPPPRRGIGGVRQGSRLDVQNRSPRGKLHARAAQRAASRERREERRGGDALHARFSRPRGERGERDPEQRVRRPDPSPGFGETGGFRLVRAAVHATFPPSSAPRPMVRPARSAAWTLPPVSSGMRYVSAHLAAPQHSVSIRRGETTRRAASSRHRHARAMYSDESASTGLSALARAARLEHSATASGGRGISPSKGSANTCGDESRYPPELLQGDGGIAPRARGGGEGVFLRLGGGSEEG